MTSTSSPQQTGKPEGGKHVHHGRTTAAWAGSMLALLGFLVGGVGMVLGPNWVLFWIGVALAILALIVTQVLRSLGHGAD